MQRHHATALPPTEMPNREVQKKVRQEGEGEEEDQEGAGSFPGHVLLSPSQPCLSPVPPPPPPAPV